MKSHTQLITQYKTLFVPAALSKGAEFSLTGIDLGLIMSDLLFAIGERMRDPFLSETRLPEECSLLIPALHNIKVLFVIVLLVVRWCVLHVMYEDTNLFVQEWGHHSPIIINQLE